MFSPKKQLSDDERVEEIRRIARARRNPKFLIFYVAILLCWTAVALHALASFGSIARSFFPGHEDAFYAAVVLGGFVGFHCFVPLAYAMIILNQWWNARHGHRTEQLLLKYYDKQKNPPPPESTPA